MSSIPLFKPGCLLVAALLLVTFLSNGWKSFHPGLYADTKVQRHVEGDLLCRRR